MVEVGGEWSWEVGSVEWEVRLNGLSVEPICRLVKCSTDCVMGHGSSLKCFEINVVPVHDIYAVRLVVDKV